LRSYVERAEPSKVFLKKFQKSFRSISRVMHAPVVISRGAAEKISARG